MNHINLYTVKLEIVRPPNNSNFSEIVIFQKIINMNSSNFNKIYYFCSLIKRGKI